jgi:Phosphodiester glycosidase/Bacterial Ig-like domain (group 2)
MRAPARTMLAVICAAGAVTASQPAAGEQSTGPQTITSGAQWHTETYQTAGGAQRAQVMNLDLGNPNLRLGAVEAGDKLIDPPDETISSMATRTGAVAGVNADFFAINATGQPDGMLVRDGTLEASPVASWPCDLEVLRDGQVEMATETYRGTVDDTTTGAASPLVALNRIDQAGLTEVTPYLGAVSIKAATIAAAAVRNGVLTVTGVQTGQTSLPQLTAGQEDLTARRGTAGSTWLQRVRPGDALRVADSLAPYGIDQIRAAVSGGAYLARGGAMAVPAHGRGENNVSYPVTGIGVSKDGRHAIMAVFDGRESKSQAVGLTRPQFAQWMLRRGAYNAIEFDSGGSAEMVARLPGQPHVSVLNHPSDGSQRPVANGLFLYSAEAAPGAAVRAVVNGGRPLAVLTGTTRQLRAYATDAEGNPAATAVHLSVGPTELATVTQLTLAAGHRPGSGWLVVRAGRAVSREPLTVADRPQTLRLSPAEPDLDNRATQQFSVTGTAPRGTPLTMTPQDATWTVSPARLGTISAGGLFTAAASGEGLATVTATARGRSATASVAVGSSATVVDPMTDTGNWALRLTNGSRATLSESTAQVARAGDAGSMDVHYSIPAASGVSQVTLAPTRGHPLTIGDAPDRRAPRAVGVWIKGIGGTPADPLARGALTFAEAYTEVNGQLDTFYPTAVTYNGWRLIEARVPPGARVPLTLKFLDFLVIDPPADLTGHIYLAGLEALYSPARRGLVSRSCLAAGTDVADDRAHRLQHRGDVRCLVPGQPGQPEGGAVQGGGRLLRQRPALVGDAGEDDAPVGGGHLPPDEAALLKLADGVGDRGGVDHEPHAHLAHGQGTRPGEGEQPEGLVGGEGQAVRLERVLDAR